jgi:hypothetical protein
MEPSKYKVLKKGQMNIVGVDDAKQFAGKDEFKF